MYEGAWSGRLQRTHSTESPSTYRFGPPGFLSLALEYRVPSPSSQAALSLLCPPTPPSPLSLTRKPQNSYTRILQAFWEWWKNKLTWKEELARRGSRRTLVGVGQGVKREVVPPAQCPAMKNCKLSSEASADSTSPLPPACKGRQGPKSHFFYPLCHCSIQRLRQRAPLLAAPQYPSLKSKDLGAGARWPLRATLNHLSRKYQGVAFLAHPTANISLVPISALCLFVCHPDHSHSPLTGPLTPGWCPIWYWPYIFTSISMFLKKVWPHHGLLKFFNSSPSSLSSTVVILFIKMMAIITADAFWFLWLLQNKKSPAPQKSLMKWSVHWVSERSV